MPFSDSFFNREQYATVYALYLPEFGELDCFRHWLLCRPRARYAQGF